MNTPSTSNTNSERIINLIIVDESGSMYSIYEEALAGMNNTIRDIKKEATDHPEGPRHFINLITFDSNHYKQLLRNSPAAKARTLTKNDYCPGASTPLFDAIGRAVNGLERHITENDAVIVTIITDGEENSSHEYTGKEIKRLIDRLTEKGWLFKYIGANQDVIENAAHIGIRMTMSFEATPRGTDEMWAKEREAMSKFYKRVRTVKSENTHLNMSRIMRDECDAEDNFFERQ